MLSEAVQAAYVKSEDDGFHHSQFTITGISPCSYGTYINYHKLDVKKNTPLDILNMKNGHYQEEECVYDLRKAGFQLRFTGKDQLIVHVGRAKVGGRPDGLIMVNSLEDVLSIKAVNTRRYATLNAKGLDAEPFIRCQEQMYLASKELQDRHGCWIYYKCKDNNKPRDLYEERDDRYSKSVVEVLDAIILEDYVPERPEICPIVGGCRHRAFCLKQDVIDLSKIGTADLETIAEQWKEGKFYKDYGKTLQEEARETLIRELGDRDVLYVEDLIIQTVIQRRFKFDRNRFITEFGAEALPKVGSWDTIESVRINIVGGIE